MQTGNRVQYRVAAGCNVTAVPCIISGVQGTIGSNLVAASVSTVVPPTATVITGTLFNGGGAASSQASPNSVAALPGMAGIDTSGAGGSIQIVSFNFALESSNIYYAGNGSGGVYCTGWEDNL